MKTEKIHGILGKIKTKYLVAAAVIGVLLIVISFFIGDGKSDQAAKTGGHTSEEYVAETEARLKQLIGQILGTDKVEVMITLDSSEENIYADSTKVNTAMTENVGASNGTKTEQSNEKEEKYIIVKDGNGGEAALVVTKVMPQIRGVAVVCPNGNNETVRGIIKNAVVTVLNVPAAKVCVVGNIK